MVVVNRDFDKIKKQLLFMLTNHCQPYIFVMDGNYRNRRELYLAHSHTGADVEIKYAVETLKQIQRIWRRPVHLVPPGSTTSRSCSASTGNSRRSSTSTRGWTNRPISFRWPPTAAGRCHSSRRSRQSSRETATMSVMTDGRPGRATVYAYRALPRLSGDRSFDRVASPPVLNETILTPGSTRKRNVSTYSPSRSEALMRPNWVR